MSSLAPQTAFLQEACSRALHSIVARLDREKEFQPYFKIVLEAPAHPAHDSWDYCDMAGRYVDAFCLIRELTGESCPEEERGLRKFLLRMAHPAEGLFYNQEGENSHYVADMFCQSRVLIGLCTWYMETGDTEIMEHLRRLVHALIQIAEYREDYAFYPRNLYCEGTWKEGGLFYEPKDLWTVKPGYGGTQLEGIMKYVQLSGDGEAREFVRKYLHYFLEVASVVLEDGSFVGHLHSQGIVPTMIGAAMYAEATQDRPLLERCERFLRFVFSHCSAFGWVPDGINWHTCETCAVGDVIYLAVYLSRLGQGDFWYEIERIGRNQLLENQFCDPSRVLAGREPVQGLAEIVHGSFASWAHPNDLLGGPDIEGCCTGGGVRAVYHILQNAVQYEAGGNITVHLLFSLSTKSLLIESYLPYEGRVVLQLHEEANLKIRIPEGIAPSDVQLFLDGNSQEPLVIGSYFALRGLHAGASLEMVFPLERIQKQETVAGREYCVRWKGNSVTELTPHGTAYQTYLRATWEADTAPQTTWKYPPQGDTILW
jgi:hypothetical protein